MDKKAYIFDLDGTLIDSMTIGWNHVLLKYLDDRGIAYPADIISQVIALGFKGIVQYYKTHFPLQESEEEVFSSLINGMQELYNNVFLAKSNVEETLRALKKRGARLNVLTASPHSFLDPCLKRLGLTDLFENLWSLEDFPTTKADPKIYELAAERLGVAPSDCVMIDDSISALRPAKEAGLATVGVYDEISASREAEMRALADKYIYNFKELL